MACVSKRPRKCGKPRRVEEYTDPRLNFLKDFRYDLGKEHLVHFGAVHRSSSEARVVDSATSWTSGFSHASNFKFVPKLSVIISEHSNDTLDNAMCLNAGGPEEELNEWRSVYAPLITARLNAAAPGANLTDADTYNIISMCRLQKNKSLLRPIYQEGFSGL